MEARSLEAVPERCLDGSAEVDVGVKWINVAGGVMVVGPDGGQPGEGEQDPPASTGGGHWLFNTVVWAGERVKWICEGVKGRRGGRPAHTERPRRGQKRKQSNDEINMNLHKELPL